MKVAYWPGCVSRGFTPELHGSMAAVAPLLDIELVPLDRASCCGAGVIAEHSQELADTLNARTFALAQQVDGAELMMNICSTCQGAQSECQERLDASADYREQINANLEGGLSYEAGLTNKNFLWLLVEEIGLDALKDKVTRPLTNLKVGPFYGCYIVRPKDRLGIDADSPRDTYLDQVIETLGGTVIDYAGSHKCCGFPIITMNKQASLTQAGTHLGDAVDADADCLVTPCPLCHLNLDLQQPLAEKVVGRELNMPVLHLPQLVGLALGPVAQAARPQPPRRQADGGRRLDDVGRGRRRRVVRRLVATARRRGDQRRRPHRAAGDALRRVRRVLRPADAGAGIDERAPLALPRLLRRRAHGAWRSARPTPSTPTTSTSRRRRASSTCASARARARTSTRRTRSCSASGPR